MTDPKFQWSKFHGPDRNEQYVVRTDDFEDFIKAKTQIEELFVSSRPKIVPETVNVDDLPAYPEANKTNPYEETPDQEHVCSVHHKQMKERVNKRTGGTFYDHRMKNEAGVWLMCSGDGQWKDSSF